MQMSWSSTSAVFAYFRDKRNAGTTRRATGQSRVASSATYQCKWPKTTEILGCKASRERNYYADVTIIAMRMLRSEPRGVVHFFWNEVLEGAVSFLSLRVCLFPRSVHTALLVLTLESQYVRVVTYLVQKRAALRQLESRSGYVIHSNSA